MLVLLFSATLLAVSSAAQQPAHCAIGSPSSLSLCVGQLLVDLRDKVRWEADPLSLPDYSRDGLRAWDIVIVGLADYKVTNVSVALAGKRRLAVRAAISWPEVTGALSAEVRRCSRLVRGLCASARGRPHLYLEDASAVLTTTLQVTAGPDGQPVVKPDNTAVAVTLTGVRVKANLRSFVGVVNNLIGDPASRIATELSGRWWRINKATIEKKVVDVLNKVVWRGISLQLGQLLKL